jgi:hypothetical protein
MVQLTEYVRLERYLIKKTSFFNLTGYSQLHNKVGGRKLSLKHGG